MIRKPTTILPVLVAIKFLLCNGHYFRDIVGEHEPDPSPDNNSTHQFMSSDNCHIHALDGQEEKPFKAIRVKYFILEMPNFTQANLVTLKELLDDSVLFFKKVMMVKRSKFKQAVMRFTTCGDVRNHYPNHTSSDVCDPNAVGGISDADFVIYVQQLKEWDGCDPYNNVLGMANSCSQYAFDGRPRFGRMYLCPYTLNMNMWNRHSLARTLQHEMLHAMGFNDLGLNLPHLKTWANRTWRVNSKMSRRNLQVQIVSSPMTKSFVRYYFDCDQLDGAEIENEGGGGTAGVHWEKRIYGGETMSGYISRRSYLSELTFAFFEDTGWYKINFAATDSLVYAKGKGCTFAMGSCRDYMDSLGAENQKRKAAHPYCNWADFVANKKAKSRIRECNEDREYYSECTFVEVKDNLDPHRTYFADNWTMIDGKNVSGWNVYGWANTTDGCPQWVESHGGAGKVGDSVCTNMYGQPLPSGNWGAELFGNESICFAQDGKFEVYDCWPGGLQLYYSEKGAHGAGCYKYKCEDGRVQVQANYSLDGNQRYDYMKAWKVCWGEGQLVNIRRHQFSGKVGDRRYHKGSIVCPSCKEICENKPRYPNFKCAKDIKINARDYSDVPCDQGFSNGRESRVTGLETAHVIMIIVVVLSNAYCRYVCWK